MNLSGKRVLVVGLGESGLAMARWLSRQGAGVRVVDSRATPPNVDVLRAAVPEAELFAGSFAAEAFADLDLIAISPGVPVDTPAVQAAVARGVPLVSEIELFVHGVRALPQPAQLLAITGSNGKTTTTALTAHLLNAAGMAAVACGNISPSALDALMAAQDAGAMPAVWVLELSSFQLETTQDLGASAAVVLNVSEDHLDRHLDMAAYAAAKARVFNGARRRVINRDDPHNAAWITPDSVSFGLQAPSGADDFGLADGVLVRGTERLVALSELKLVGLHNAANALAALALCEAVGLAPQAAVAGLKTFTGLAHRVEFVAEIGGVRYYDDSKGTNVGATVAALEGLRRKVVLIAGGDGKGQDFSPLKDAFARYARAVVLIGRDAAAIQAAVDGCGVALIHAADMDAAVLEANARAQAGDVVLLSPACASLDMFRNYAHRAQVFIDAVKRLPDVRPV